MLPEYKTPRTEYLNIQGVKSCVTTTIGQFVDPEYWRSIDQNCIGLMSELLMRHVGPGHYESIYILGVLEPFKQIS